MKNIYLEKIIAKTSQNSWLWISIIFFGQGICSILFSRFMRIPSEQVFQPIVVLFLGGACSLLFFILNGSGNGLKWKWIIPAAFYGSFIYLMSNRSFPGVQLNFDASYFHPVEYATFGLLLARFWYWVVEAKGFPAFALLVVLTGAAFGCLDEYHQSFVAGRDPSASDFIMDVAGILFSLLITAAFRRVARRRLTTGPQAEGR
ncbi:MAG: VanZ family protein [Syntrophobacter sp.]